MNCKDYRAAHEEADIAGGGLPARCGEHAAVCAECRAFGEERASLRGLVAGLARVDAPPDFEFRLRARMAATNSGQSRPRLHNLLPRPAWLAAAGCLALAAAIALQMKDSQTPGALKPTPPSTTEQPVANPVAAVNPETASPVVSVGEGGEVRPKQLASPADKAVEAVATRIRARASSAVAVANASKSQPRRPAAITAAQPFVEAVASSGTRIERTESSTPSMMGSPITVLSAIPLPVQADEQPLRVLFKDMQGASRVVKVDPVAFGSNEPAARPANVTFTKAAKKQRGVW